jgi:protein ImuB
LRECGHFWQAKLGDIKAEFGVDVLRLVAVQTEPIHAHQHKGHIEAGQAVAARLLENTKLDDLIGTLGARIGLEALTRLYPGDSHIPEKAAQVQAAAWSAPHLHWPASSRARTFGAFSTGGPCRLIARRQCH